MSGHKPSNHEAVFGPVPSRRLGMSLGVDLLLPKTCSLNCRYCELGPTTKLTTRRAVYRDPDQVLEQVRRRLAELDYAPDYLTLAGSGEPCLHSDLGRVLAELKRLEAGQVAVLTNSTLCPDPRVRAELAEADLLVPSLDAVSQDVFRRLNRPALGLKTQEIVEGLVALRREFPGQIWLEILLVEGINDSPEEIDGLLAAAERIAPDKVQLNTVVRPPALAGTRPLSFERLQEIARRFAVPAEVIAPPQTRAAGDHGELADEVVQTCRRRPLTLEDVAAFSGLTPARARELVESLVARGRLRREDFGDRVFFRGI